MSNPVLRGTKPRRLLPRGETTVDCPSGCTRRGRNPGKKPGQSKNLGGGGGGGATHGCGMCKQEKNKIKEQRNKIVANGPALELDWRRGGVTAVQGIGRRGGRGASTTT